MAGRSSQGRAGLQQSLEIGQHASDDGLSNPTQKEGGEFESFEGPRDRTEGVEAGKKAVGEVLALQKRVLAVLNEARPV